MTQQRFDGQIVLVTGGTSGIGEAISRRLAAEGATVCIVGRSEERANRIIAELGMASFYKCDVSQPAQIEELFSSTVTMHGRIDVLVNCAGIVSVGAVETMSDEDWRAIIDTDLSSVMHSCRWALPIMKSQQRGSIINVASISGLAGDFGMAAYNAAKAAVVNFTRSVALDAAKAGVRVNALCPGAVRTPMFDAVDGIRGLIDDWTRAIPMQRFGRPEEIAGVAAFLASEDASYITGAVIIADGGVTAATGQPNIPSYF